MEIDQFEMQVVVPFWGLIPQFHPVEGEVNSQSYIYIYIESHIVKLTFEHNSVDGWP